MLEKGKNGKPSYKRFHAPVNQAKNVPRGTLLVSLSERFFCQTVRTQEPSNTTVLKSNGDSMVAAQTTIARTALPGGDQGYYATVYFGPRDYFSLKKVGVEEAFPIGAVGQIGLILVAFLSWIAGVTKNYGIALVLFSVLVTCATAPFTLLGFRSMRKMQELKPQVDKLMAQHKNDPSKAQTEMFALYKAHKVSPLSGCLPMLLQMPVFIALFQAISHYSELRGQRFLWIADLSLPDRLAKLPFSIPLLGNEVNALPIVMALAMYIQTKMSQGQMPSNQSNPTAKIMSGPLMPIMFGIMFYQFPSGLVLYWLTNSLMSLVWYRVAK